MRSCTSVLVTNGLISGRPNPAPKPNSVIISGSFDLLTQTLAEACCHHGVSRLSGAPCAAPPWRYKSPAGEDPDSAQRAQRPCEQAREQVGTELDCDLADQQPGLKL